MTELLGQLSADFISVAVLGALGLRKLVLMDGHHRARVVILTGLLWALAAYLFFIAYVPSYPGCTPDYEGPGTLRIYSASLSEPAPHSPARRVSL